MNEKGLDFEQEDLNLELDDVTVDEQSVDENQLPFEVIDLDKLVTQQNGES